MSIWSSRILPSVTQSQSLQISSSITNVKVKGEKAVPNAKKMESSLKRKGYTVSSDDNRHHI